MIETQIPGLFPPEYQPGERINLSALVRDGKPKAPELPPMRIVDARTLQASNADEHQFLEKHGFVLLNAPTVVTDWGDPAQVAVYQEEVERLIRTRLYPERQMVISQPPFVVRRGAGTDNPQYGSGVHQDHAITADDYQHNVAAFAGTEAGQRWRDRFDEDAYDAFMVLDFWRTTNMAGPLAHMPLVFCDPASLEADDIVPTAFEGIAPGGAVTHHLGLRFNLSQRWYYYSGMGPDEVLVFKIFQWTKGEVPQRHRACFHSAVTDPATPPDAQPRQSCEHRVEVLFEARPN